MTLLHEPSHTLTNRHTIWLSSFIVVLGDDEIFVLYFGSWSTLWVSFGFVDLQATPEKIHAEYEKGQRECHCPEVFKINRYHGLVAV